MDELKKERIYVFLLAAIQFSHILDFVIMMPLGPSLMSELQISPAQFGALVSSYNFSAGIAAVLLSTVADRFERKRTAMVMLIAFILATYFCGFSRNYAELLTARIITGAIGGLLNSIVFAMVTDLVPFERRGRAMGSLMSSFSVASVLGIPLGLSIADWLGWQWTFHFIATATVLVATVCQIILPIIPVDGGGRSIREVLKEFGLTLLHRNYLNAHAFMFAVAFSMFLLIPFLAPFAVKNMGQLTTDLKFMYLVSGIVTIFTARFFGFLTDKWGAPKTFLVLGFASCVPIFLFSQASVVSFTIYLVISALFMSLISGRMIPVMTLLSAVPAQRDRGSFMGVLNSMRSLGSAFATLVAGLLIIEAPSGQLVGFDYTAYISIALLVITVFWAPKILSR
jgi:predicted MFS family arabinose efflux permease